ncbi:MAG: hypothetical protein WBI14_09835 [Anaerolineaceae bacterium]
MNMFEVSDHLALTALTYHNSLLNVEVKTAYQSDLLSCVMSGGGEKSIWVTLINNINIVAVAKLLDIPVIIVTENAMPDESTLDRAKSEGISIFLTPKGNYQVAGELWTLGIKE